MGLPFDRSRDCGAGAYLDRMGDACGDCRYRPNRRQGDDACPFTTLYWDFLARNAAAFEGNHRMRPMLRSLERLSDLDAVRARARSVLEGLERGQI